jgi:uncharacterized protein
LGIGLDDLLGFILHAMVDQSIAGPVNAVSPNPITNADFTATLGKVLSRLTVFSIPKSITKLALGEKLANAAILASSRVIPERLIKSVISLHSITLHKYMRIQIFSFINICYIL